MDITNALVPVDPNAAALAAFGFDEDVPMKPSKLELIQPTKAAEDSSLHAGAFMDVQSNTQTESLNIVILRINVGTDSPTGISNGGRVLFPPGGDLGAKPVCRSVNSIMPIVSDDLVRQDGGLGCAKCPYSQWKRVGGKQIRPACNETGSILLAEFETQFIYRFNVKGTSLTPVKDLKDTIRKMVRTAKVKGMPIPPYGLTFKMSSVRVKGQKGTYYIPKFTPTGQVNPADVPGFEKIFQHFMTKKTDDEITPVTDPVGAALEGEYQAEPPAGYEAA